MTMKHSRLSYPALLALALCLTAATAGAQDAAPAEGPRRAAPAAPATAPEKSGFLGAVERWFDRSVEDLNSGLKTLHGNLDALGSKTGQAARDAVGAITARPLVTGREACQQAGNGAPDCVAAAAALCRGKGYGGGRSVDIETAQACPARVWLSGRAPAPGECPLRTYVTRAMCE